MRKVLFILGQLSDSDVEWMSAAGERRRIPAGTELIREGSDLDAVYLVLDGQLSVWAGGRVKLADIASGDILGEMSLLDSSPTMAAVRCDTEVLVLAILKETLRRHLEDDLGFAARFYKALALFLADRMRNTVQRMGYGKVDDEHPRADPDELDIEVLDKVHLAGARFERMLRKLAGS